MNIKHDILCGTLLLLTGVCLFQACREDMPDIYDREELISQGRYLTALSADTYSLDINADPRPFAVGTPYRLLAFTKPYHADRYLDQTVAADPRFNTVAWEGATENGLRFINIDRDPSRWFGFSALDDKERGGDDDLVSLDFYGFTYGAVQDHTDSYIPVEGWQEEDTRLSDLSHPETVTDGKLNDLMRGVLLNQNISTAGIEHIEADGNQVHKPVTQSVIQFNHCFSKLHIQVSQQPKENEVDADGNPVPGFDNLFVENIEVTNTFQSGTVSLADGKVNVSGKIDRTLQFDEGFTGQVTLNNSDAGEMILFPSDGNALSNKELADGYAVGLKITVKSTVKKDIENMLANTNDPDNPGEISTEMVDGVEWYKGTIVKDEIIDYYTDPGSTDRTLYFKQNTSYMLIITFQKDGVRIITVIPMIEEWLPGEGTPSVPWQDQAMGQPQMFDNILWSDRNMGADHYDATGAAYEKCVGYFYQAGRNIPYYPFTFKIYDINNGKIPDLKDKARQDLANGSSTYLNSDYRFYPVVDSRILRMTGNWYWVMSPSQNPQMFIPETMPTNAFFDFSKGADANSPGLTAEQDMHWEKDPDNQPVSGVWIIPSSQDFLSIFPSTPHAGNITFRTGGRNETPMNWGEYNNEMNDTTKVLRVTVPYYAKGDKNPQKPNASANYIEAWNRLKSNNDPGCSTYGYADTWNSPGPGKGNNPKYEPDGDPEDGFASVYVISREDESKVTPDILQNSGNWVIKSWGTIYAIKRIYTSGAYRMRWRVINAKKSAANPCFYIEICRYRCKPDAKLTQYNYKDYDWSHPAATLYIPICGLGDWTGEYINFGTECQYATSDPIVDGKTSAVQIKVSGNSPHNAYIAVVRGVINRTFGMQIRPVRINGGGK